MREHRLYQADWLLRFYDFSLDEVASSAEGGMLDQTIDPKLAWALAHPDKFPLDVNRAPREMLLRVPGLGVRAVDRIIASRRHAAIRLVDLDRLTRSAKKVRPFVVTSDWRPGGALDPQALKPKEKAKQLDLFAA